MIDTVARASLLPNATFARSTALSPDNPHGFLRDLMGPAPSRAIEKVRQSVASITHRIRFARMSSSIQAIVSRFVRSNSSPQIDNQGTTSCRNPLFADSTAAEDVSEVWMSRAHDFH